jgi:hypothetical protein
VRAEENRPDQRKIGLIRALWVALLLIRRQPYLLVFVIPFLPSVAGQALSLSGLQFLQAPFGLGIAVALLIYLAGLYLVTQSAAWQLAGQHARLADLIRPQRGLLIAVPLFVVKTVLCCGLALAPLLFLMAMPIGVPRIDGSAFGPANFLLAGIYVAVVAAVISAIAARFAVRPMSIALQSVGLDYLDTADRQVPAGLWKRLFWPFFWCLFLSVFAGIWIKALFDHDAARFAVAVSGGLAGLILPWLAGMVIMRDAMMPVAETSD